MKSWNSVHNLAIPGLVAFIEAGWVWAWFSTTANIAHGVPADVPFLALALPAIIAAGLAGTTARIRWVWWLRALMLAPFVILGIALAAGVIGSLYEHGSFGALALHPWTQKGNEQAAEAAIAWFAAAVAVSRGTWLGFRELSRTHAIRSVGIAGLAYVLFFIVCSVHHAAGTFHPDVGVAGTLVLLSFPAAISVVALVNERELERSALREERSRPSLAWLGAVLVPMAAIAVIGAALALALGPLAPPIGRVVRFLILWFARLLDAIVNWFGRFVHPKKQPLGLRHVGGAAPTVHTGASHIPPWVTVTAAVFAVIGLAALIYYAIRAMKFMRAGRQLVEAPTATTVEERESVFSWSHLMDQLRALLRRLFRRKGAVVATGSAVSSTPVFDPTRESVRRHYLRVLVAARAAGHGRSEAETPLELENRLAGVTDADADVALRAMTVEYELVRYGEEPDSDEQIERVRQHAEVVVTVLESGQQPTP